MRNTANNFNSNSVDVDGLDDLYKIEAQRDPSLAQTDPILLTPIDPEIAQTDSSPEGIPLAEAAELLDLHIDTVRKRLQKGKIAGFKVDEKYGQKWFVCTSELTHIKAQLQDDPIQEAQADPAQAQGDPIQEAQADPAQAQGDPIQETQADPAQAQGDPIQETQADPAQAQGDPILETQADPVQAQSDPILEVELEPDHGRTDQTQLLAIIENQAHQLKAAGDVIMYMRSQLEEKEQQLKLLTDKQLQPTKWQQFISWFLGR